MALIDGTRRGDRLNGTESSDTINGLEGADQINGNGGNDTLSGGEDRDTLTGGAGVDTFVFAAGDGEDTITDLAAGETVQISGYSAARSLVQSGTSVVVTLSNDDRITFQNTTVATV